MHRASPTNPDHVAVSSDLMKKRFSANCYGSIPFRVLTGGIPRSILSENKRCRRFLFRSQRLPSGNRAEHCRGEETRAHCSSPVAIRHTPISSWHCRNVGITQLWPCWAIRISASSGPQVPAW
jgi:hypothetical protein